MHNDLITRTHTHTHTHTLLFIYKSQFESIKKNVITFGRTTNIQFCIPSVAKSIYVMLPKGFNCINL
jgi:hypothetical protein